MGSWWSKTNENESKSPSLTEIQQHPDVFFKGISNEICEKLPISWSEIQAELKKYPEGDWTKIC